MSSNFERLQEIINTLYAENFSCLSHWEVRNPHSLYNSGTCWTSIFEIPVSHRWPSSISSISTEVSILGILGTTFESGWEMLIAIYYWYISNQPKELPAFPVVAALCITFKRINNSHLSDWDRKRDNNHWDSWSEDCYCYHQQQWQNVYFSFWTYHRNVHILKISDPPQDT